MSLGYRSAVSRFLAIFAPTTSWWWKETRPPARSAGSSACRCRAAARPAAAPGPGPSVLQRDRLLEHGEGVLVDVLVPVVLVALQAQRRQLGQHPVGEPGVDQQRQARARVGRRASACPARPAPARPRRSRSGPAISRHRRDHRRARPEARAARRTGRPASSAAGRRRRTPPGVPGVRSTRAARSSSPPYGSTNVASGQRHRHRVDGEVAADQVVLEGVAVRHLRLARGPVVGLRRGRS